MSYYVGVDIGTTSAKAVAFSAEGAVLHKESLSYHMLHTQPNYAEQDADEIWDAVIHCINKLIAALTGQPLFISFSSAMHSIMAVDKNGKPLTNCITWADNRAACIAENLRNTEWGKEIYSNTGVPLHAMSPLCKLLWLKDNESGVFNTAYKFIGIKEYIFFKLFGAYVVDTAIASATGLLHLKTLQWSEAVLDFVGVSAQKLSQIVPVKTAYYYTPALQPAAPLHLKDETPFIIGSSDGALANLGSGAVSHQSMAISIGTSAAARVLTDKPETDAAMRTFCYHAKDDEYIVGGASNNGAVVLQWLKEILLEEDSTYDQLFQLASSVEPGCDGLLFLPYILGERAPVWNSHARGVFFGLSIQHTKAHMIRAAIEGVVYGLYSIGKVMEEKNEIKELQATGGFAHSSLWLQILADVFNKKVVVSDTVESSALGAVMLGMEAKNISAFIKRNILSVHQPDQVRHEAYTKGFEKFVRIYELVKNEFVADLT